MAVWWCGVWLPARWEDVRRRTGCQRALETPSSAVSLKTDCNSQSSKLALLQTSVAQRSVALAPENVRDRSHIRPNVSALFPDLGCWRGGKTPIFENLSGAQKNTLSSVFTALCKKINHYNIFFNLFFFIYQ